MQLPWFSEPDMTAPDTSATFSRQPPKEIAVVVVSPLVGGGSLGVRIVLHPIDTGAVELEEQPFVAQ
jgi:hypothetical protein